MIEIVGNRDVAFNGYSRGRIVLMNHPVSTFAINQGLPVSLETSTAEIEERVRRCCDVEFE